MPRLRRRKKGRYDGPFCRAPVPTVPGAWGFYPTKETPRGEVPDFRQPLRWVDEAPGEPSCDGHWEWA